MKITLSLSAKAEALKKYQYTNIDSADKDTKNEILMRFSGGREIRLRAKSGLFIAPHNWNAAKGEIKSLSRLETNEVKELQALKIRLDNLCNEITTAFANTDTAAVDKQWLDNIIDKYHNPEKYEVKPTKDETLLEWINDFIETAPKRKKPKTNKYIGEGIIKHYKVTAGYIRQFAAFKRKNRFSIF